MILREHSLQEIAEIFSYFPIFIIIPGNDSYMMKDNMQVVGLNKIMTMTKLVGI